MSERIRIREPASEPTWEERFAALPEATRVELQASWTVAEQYLARLEERASQERLAKIERIEHKDAATTRRHAQAPAGSGGGLW